MRLSAFITANLEPILQEWVAFAKNHIPAADSMNDVELLDHGKLILQEIAADMSRPQDDDERLAKSQGDSTTASTSRHVPSRSHARQRERQGFDVEQMVSEYRALRATVLRLWSGASNTVQAEDLDDMIRFNEAVDQAVAESLAVFVAEVSKTRDLFLGMLGHELRGPLGAIGNCAALVLKTRPDDARPVAIIRRSVAQMKALLDDLMAYTKDRLGAKLSISPSPCRLDEVVRNALDEIDALNANTQDSGNPLELATQGEMRGEWDARRLHQVLSNLVFNALKYGRPGSRIRIGLDGTAEDEVVMSVSNEGKPIAAALLPQLFEPLVRAGAAESDDHHSQPAGANMGLGLYVVRQIALAHGGDVRVQSDDLATCFEIRLPRVCCPDIQMSH